jgi:hypothetical protein
MVASSGIGTGGTNFAVGSHILGAAIGVSGDDVRASGEELTCPQPSASDHKNAHSMVLQLSPTSAVILDPDSVRGR